MKLVTLIPAYKPKYLIELLTALKYQTVKPDQVIVSDDSPDQAFIHALDSEPLRATVAELNVVAVRGPRAGAWANFQHLLKVWEGRSAFVHYLLDDDVIYPPFYERHLQAHAAGHFNVSCSRRWTALESGQPITSLNPPEIVANSPNRLFSMPAASVFASTAAVSANWLGEYSNVVLRGSFAPQIAEARMAGIPFAGLEDLGAFLLGTIDAPMAYINEHLGYFRTSAGQNSADPMGRPMKLAHLAYLALAIASRRIGQITPESAAACIANLAPLIVHRYSAQADMARLCGVMPALARGGEAAEQAFLEAWDAYLA